MSKNRSRFSRLSVLAPAALSACMDASVLAVPAAGAIVSTVLKELSKAFMLKKWFHGSMSAKEAEHLMMEKGKDGSYLVRESKAHPGDYVLSVRVRGRVSHVMIKKQNNKYEVGSGELFDDLVGLIEHFRSYPMTEASGAVLRLLQPVSGTRLRVADLKNRLDVQDVDSKESETRSGLDGEFRSLQALEQLQELTTRAALRPENCTKNRYRNVLPYDQTRVVLKGRGTGQDYINASYIRPAQWDSSASSVQSSNESLDSVQSVSSKKESNPSPPLVSKSLSDDALREVRRCVRMDKLNGNYDKVNAKDKVYIATQGCLSNTKDDFWWMLWQEDVRVIVMITNELEKGKIKCERYWPLPGQQESFEGLTVKAISETSYEEYLLRELDVENGGCVRTIYQYHFTAWPDHGTPTEPDGVLALMEDVNRRLALVASTSKPPEQNVICVHCSAGVGRTGTFVVLDSIVDAIHSYGHSRDIDVHRAVRRARAQRGGMVQNKAQYRFIYQALAAFTERRQTRTHKIQIYS